MTENRKDKVRQEVDRYRKSRGAVAVFLAIILIPCIVVASLFVDVSRVQYSKMQAESAADLALHSMLSNYDTILQDYYGIVASCQDTEEFLKKSENYFCGIMRTAGVDEGAELFSDFIQGLISGDTSDLLKISFLEEPNMEPLENSSPGTNANLMEGAIVEFMKYRGVYYIGKRFIELGTRLSGADWGFSNGLDDNKDIADAKEEYGKAESELLKQAFYTYMAIRNYDIDQESEQIPSEDKYKDVEDKMKLIREDLYPVTDLITKYYAGTAGIYLVNFPTGNKNQYTSTVTKEKYKVGEGQYVLTLAAYNELVQDFNNDCAGYLQQVDTAAQNIANACSGVSFTSGTNEALYCMKICELLKGHETDLTNINNAANGLMYMYAELKAALEVEPEKDDSGTVLLPSDYKDTLQEWMNDIDICWSKYLRSDPGYNRDTVPYNALRYSYYSQAHAETTVKKVKNREYTFDSKAFGSGKTVGSFASAAYGYLTDRKEKLIVRRDELNTAINGGKFTFKVTGDEYKCGSLDNLKDLAQGKADRLEDWRGEAYSHDSDYAKQDQEEITKIDNLIEDGGDTDGDRSENMSIKIDAKSVDDLKKRLENINNDIKECCDALDALKYGGKAVSSLGSADAYINSACASVIPREGLSMSLTENENAAKGYADQLITPGEDGLYKAPSIDPTDLLGNDPDLTQSHGNVPVLYDYLRKTFKNKEKDASDNTKKAEKKLNEFRDAGSKAMTGITSMDSQANSEKGESIPKSDHTKSMGVIDAFVGIFDVLKDLITDTGVAGEDLRDRAFVTEYVFRMFTWSSFNNEGRYRLAGNVSLKDYPYLSQAGGWGEDDITDDARYDDQTLTNKTFNKTTLDKAYLGEIEYILYGKGSFKDNVGKAYKDIFAIREVLDITSGFMNFWNPGKNPTAGVIEAIANAISAATLGMVPAILVKTVLILALATLEACNDLDALKKGVPVVIYKMTDKEWKFAIPSASSWEEAAPGANKGGDPSAPEDPNGLYYSDYLYLFFTIGTTTSAYPSMLLRIGDVIEANIQQTGKEGYELDNAVMYYQLTADVAVEPLLLDMTIIDAYKDVDLDEFKESTDWRHYKLDVIRGYS